jgi:signal transduction histidine kinase
VTSAPGNDLSPAAVPSVLTPAVFRLADALPGRSLVVRREQVDAAWQLVHVHGLASATSRPAHPADRPGGSDEAPEAITGASPRHSHTLALPYPALDTWLDAWPEWFGDSVRSALAGEAETPAAAAASARVLPIDALAAIVWLDPAEALARQADGERESFVYTVSHDLRAPIRVIEGFTRIIKEDHGLALDRVGNDHLDRVLGAAARMTSMIDALLALSRLSTRPLAHDNVDLTALAHQVIDEWRHQAPGRQAEVNIAPGLTVQGDPTLLRSVLDNLLGNAWKYCARRELTRIEFGLHTPASERGGLRVFVVRDNGAGFDMRFADKLFGPFQRLHSASEFAGTGVGLASVRRIVRRHGGDVWAEAQVDQGASFYFSLP